MSRRQPRTTKAWNKQTIGFPNPDSSSTKNRMNSTGTNFGTIMNYKRELGINDGATGFRKWTGMPKVERNKTLGQQRISDAAPHSKVIQEHRRPPVAALSVPMTADSVHTYNTRSFIESSVEAMRERNIPQSAWNKIRLAEMSNVERLKYPS